MNVKAKAIPKGERYRDWRVWAFLGIIPVRRGHGDSARAMQNDEAAEGKARFTGSHTATEDLDCRL